MILKWFNVSQIEFYTCQSFFFLMVFRENDKGIPSFMFL